MITITSVPEKLEVECEGPLEVEELLQLIKQALFEWAPAGHGKFVLNTDVLTYEMSQGLNSIFSSPLMEGLIEAEVTFLFQIKGLKADALNGLLETPDKSFPANTSFICLDEDGVDLWVDGLILAVEHGKFSENTFVDVSYYGQLSDEQCERLKLVLGGAKASEKLMLMYASEKGELQALNSTELKPQFEATAEVPPNRNFSPRPGLRRTTKGFFEQAKDLDKALNGAQAEEVEDVAQKAAVFEPLYDPNPSP